MHSEEILGWTFLSCLLTALVGLVVFGAVAAINSARVDGKPTYCWIDSGADGIVVYQHRDWRQDALLHFGNDLRATREACPK